MSAKSAFPAIAILAASFFLPMLTPNSAANAAEPCLAAPKGPAPQGSRWYYRIERPSLRKCWRLVQLDQQPQRAAKQAAPQPQLDEEIEAPAPVANRPAARAADAETKSAQSPVTDSWVTRNVSGTSETSPLPPDPSASAMARAEIPSAPAPLGQTMQGERAPSAIVERPVQPVAAAGKSANASQPDGAPTLRLLLGAIALFGFLACAVFLIMGIVRRRTDVLITVQNADREPFEAPPEVRADDAPTFAPLPPIGLMPQEDDVDEALRRFARNVKRRAAQPRSGAAPVTLL